MQLTNKIILVTGASSGIGQAVAIACAKQGAVVLIHFRKNKKGAEETLTEVKKYSKGNIFSADLSDLQEVKVLFEQIKNDYPQIDMLVNCAGEATPGAFADESVWKHQLENIFMSQVHATNEFLVFNTSRDIRKIVNISSIYGIAGMENPEFPQYSAAKAAVSSFTRSLAKKYAPHVLVNGIAPGYTWTPPWEGTAGEEKKACENLTKIKRFIRPEEIASTVVFLLQNDAITGEIIRVDGGLHLQDLL